jgi:hypothetical protein
LDRTFYSLLLVTWRIRDIGQNVLQSSVQTGSSNSPSYGHIYFLIAFLEGVIIRNIIAPNINYKIIIPINNNSAVINYNLFRCPRSHYSSNFSRAAENFVRNLYAIFTRALKKVCQPWRTVCSTRYNATEESGRQTHFDNTYPVHYSHKHLIVLIVTVTTGETSRIVQCCGRADRMETTNTYVISRRK